MIIYVNWEKENKIFYSILFYSTLGITSGKIDERAAKSLQPQPHGFLP
jgi:hypothetical protein